MITPTYLIQVFARLGYPVDEQGFKRRLTDWRQKGLLPPLKEKGRQHHGKVYYWDTPDIIAHALTIYELFKIYSRADWVMLSTWFAGYSVPIQKVREIWLKRLDSELMCLQTEIRDEDEMADVLSRFSLQASRKKKKAKVQLVSPHFQNLLSNLLFNPDFDFDDFRYEELAEELNQLLHTNPAITDGEVFNLDFIEPITDFISEHLSLIARYELISMSTNQSLEQAHRDWRRAIPILKWIIEIISSNPSLTSKEFIPWLAFIGKFFITINLVLRKLGYGLKIEKVLIEILDSISRMKVDDEWRLMIQEPNKLHTDSRFDALRERVLKIWENTPMNSPGEFLLENY